MPTKSFYSLQSIGKIENNIFCQLLEIDEYKILLNIGSDSELKVPYYDDLEKIIDSIDCILISHCEIKYFGGLISLSEKFKGKIIMTLPIFRFSKIIFNEIFKNDEILKNQKFTLKELENIYDSITIVKYSQPIDIGILRVTAQNAGHSLGGTIWSILKDNENITVALDINHKKINHLDGCDILNLKKSFLFLLNCDFVGESFISRKMIEKEFFELLNLNKNNLIFVCSLMRSFELCWILNDFLTESKDPRKCAFISFQSKIIHEILKGFLEWSGDIALKKFTSQKINPFRFENIDFFDLYSDIDPETKIFIVLDENFNSIFSQKLLYDKNSEENLVIFFDEIFEKNFLLKNELNVPEFIISENKKEHEKENDNKDDQKEQFFTNQYNNFFSNKNFELSNLNKKIFPFRNLPKPKDIYGEFIDTSLFVQEIQEEENSILKKEEIIKEKTEIIKIFKKSFIPLIRTKTLNFNFLIDGNSMKDILESILIEKLILFGKDKNLVNFFQDYCTFTKSIKEIVNLKNKKVNLSIDNSISKVDLNENFLESTNLKQKKNLHLALFIGEIKNNILFFKRPLTNKLVYGQSNLEILNLQILSKQFLENNFRVRKIDHNKILVEEKVEILLEENKVQVCGDYSDEFVLIRNILYENFIFIE